MQFRFSPHSFHDKNDLIRENAVRSVVVLRPEVPLEALPALLALARSTDNPRTLAVVAHGLARCIGRSPDALKALEDLLSDSSVAKRRIATQAVGSAKVDHVAIVEKLRAMLDDPDRSVALDAIGSLGMIGPAAIAARSVLERIASANADSEMSQAARLALSRIDARPMPPR
jgi:HEAT repeat protein